MTFRKPIALFFFILLLLTPTTTKVVASNPSNLLIHGIESSVNEDGSTYTVNIRVSGLSDRNSPIKNATTRDFEVKEDGKTVILDSVELVKDEPMTAFVVLDMGATMQGERLRLTNSAVTNFINDLYRGDQIAIFSFNEDFREVIPLTDNLNQARNDFQNALWNPGGGACVFDAIFAALEHAKMVNNGRQAIVVLSSRKDVTANGYQTCSSVTPDNILSLSRELDRHIPVYTIGIGVDVDGASLQRIAEGTNGLYSSSTSNYDIADLFTATSNRFISEYIITYTSTNSHGKHTLSVQLDNLSESEDFVLPGLPPVVSIAHPSSFDDIEPCPTKIVLSLVERGLALDSLVFKINGIAIGVGGKISQPPFEYEIDFSHYDGELITLTILAQDKEGNLLSETAYEVDFREDIELEQEGLKESPPKAEKTDTCPEGYFCMGNLQLTGLHLILILAGLGSLIIIAIILVFTMTKKKRRTGKLDAEEKVSIFDEATLDGIALPMANMGRLTILASDDPLMVGKEFQLIKSPTSIGRSVNNDIPLPKDSAVSRKHIEIVAEGDDVSLEEVFKTLSDGTRQPPTYGTYINDRKVTDRSVLHTGDEISLGRRTKLRFEGAPKSEETKGSEDITMDQIHLSDFDQLDDSTRDG